MLAEVVLILFQYGILQAAYLLIVLVLREVGDDFGHTSDVIVVFQPVDEPGAVVRHQPVVGRGDHLRERRFAHRLQKLPERQGMQVEGIDLSNGERNAFVDGDAQQRTCGDDGIFRRVFAKVLQRLQRARGLLDFIEDDQCISGRDLDLRLDVDVHQDALDIVIIVKDALHPLIVVEGHIGDFGEILFAKFLHQPGFSDLARPLQYQRLSVWPVFPRSQCLHRVPFHLNRLRST